MSPLLSLILPAVSATVLPLKLNFGNQKPEAFSVQQCGM